jgi:hypothetical protein
MMVGALSLGPEIEIVFSWMYLWKLFSKMVKKLHPSPHIASAPFSCVVCVCMDWLHFYTFARFLIEQKSEALTRLYRWLCITAEICAKKQTASFLYSDAIM